MNLPTYRTFGALAASAMLVFSACLFPLDADAAGRPSDTLSDKALSEYPDAISKSIPDIAVPRFVCLSPDGSVIYSRGAQDKCKIASITKIMTAIVASEYPMDMQLTVSEHAASIPGSSAALEAGDTATLYDLCQGLMLPSGNDAAYTIAENLGAKMLADAGTPSSSWEKCVARFVDEMNLHAGQLGMTSTIFENPCGLDDEGFEGDHISCAADVAKMSQAAMNIPVIAEIASKQHTGMLLTRKGKPKVIELLNTDHLLEWRDDTRGIKTGFTNAAGACFAGAVQIREETYITVLLGGDSYDQTLGQTSLLWDWLGKSAIQQENLFNGLAPASDGNGFIVGQAAAPNQKDELVKVKVVDSGLRGKLLWQNMDSVSLELGDICLRGDIKAGDLLGKLVITDENGNREELDAYADGDSREQDDFVDEVSFNIIHAGAALGSAADGYAVDTPATFDPELVA